MVKRIKVDKKKHAFAMLDRLDKMRNDETRSNFKVKVHGETILAHRDILMAASDYFDAMLLHDTKENQRGEVEMKNVDFECVKICIDFIYGREISVPSEKYEDLMFVAHMMQLNILCEGIEELMAEGINLTSFFKLKKISDLFECQLLQQKCSEFAEENFHAISKEKDFNEIDKQFLLSMIESENIRISELEKLEILLQWVKHKISRKSDLSNFLNEVDLDKIPIGHRRYFIENDQLISEDLECFRKFSISIMNSNKIPTLNPKQQQKNILIVDRRFQNLRVFNPRTYEVTATTQRKFKGKIASYSATMLKNYIYILGGDKSVYRLKYSEETSTWERMADMINEHGRQPAAVFVSGLIYIIGGKGGMETSAVEVYDPGRNKWKKCCQKTKSSDGCSVAALEGCIYSMGGKIEGQVSKEVEKLDVIKAEWIDLSPMNEARTSSAATEWKGNIIVAGGNNNKYKDVKSVESYVVATDQWTMLPSMNVEKLTLSLILVDGQIFAFDRSASSDEPKIEKYDEQNQKWRIVELPAGTNLNVYQAVLVEAE